MAVVVVAGGRNSLGTIVMVMRPSLTDCEICLWNLAAGGCGCRGRRRLRGPASEAATSDRICNISAVVCISLSCACQDIVVVRRKQGKIFKIAREGGARDKKRVIY